MLHAATTERQSARNLGGLLAGLRQGRPSRPRGRDKQRVTGVEGNEPLISHSEASACECGHHSGLDWFQNRQFAARGASNCHGSPVTSWRSSGSASTKDQSKRDNQTQTAASKRQTAERFNGRHPSTQVARSVFTTRGRRFCLERLQIKAQGVGITVAFKRKHFTRLYSGDVPERTALFIIKE